MYFLKALNDINVSYMSLNNMIKDQEAVLYLDSFFINWGGISIYPNYFLVFRDETENLFQHSYF